MTEPLVEPRGETRDAGAPATGDGDGEDRLTRGGVAWAMFEGGRDPYIVLVVIYIFMPYVATVMVGDPVRGQEVLSRWNQYVGWAVMLTAPVLGACLDKLGPRKPWLGATVAMMAPMMASLWWARPDGRGLSVSATMFLAMAINLLFTYSEVLHNSLLVRAAGLRSAHRASGLALALGNGLSVVALAVTAWAFALPGKVTWSWVPRTPLFGLSPEAHEPERVVALISAALLVLGALPLFILTPDEAPTGIRPVRVIGAAVKELIGMLRAVRGYRDAVTFLVSRMFFVDGMNAVLIYSGVYAAGVMRWTPLEMLAYGLVLSVLATAGAMVGSTLDGRLGPKRALQIEIGMITVGLLMLLGMGPGKILYLWRSAQLADSAIWNGPVFSSLPDLVFVAIGGLITLFVCGSYASSRTLLTRLTPPSQTGAFFGVYALSGVATSWLAPTLVNLGTHATHSQQGGFATIIVLLVVGVAGVTLVKGGGRRQFASPETVDLVGGA